MKKKLFFLFLILASSTIFAQNKNNLQGKVLNFIDQSTISNVKITLYKRDVRYTKDGLPILLQKKYTNPIKIFYSDSSGAFHLDISLNKETEYFYLTLENNEFQAVFKDILILKKNIPVHNLNFQLQPKVLDAKSLFKLEEKAQKQFQDKNVEKYQDEIIFPTYTSSSTTSRTDEDCTYENIPENVYVQFLHNGYNGSNSNSGYTGYINFDEYIAGVVKAEIAGITENLNVKKAQAVAARTYSMRKHLDQNPVNIGQAYKDTYDSGSLLSSTETSNEVILYENEVITAIYGARCNGNFTQNAHEGIWSPYSSCNTSGSYVPYLISKACSGHNNCDDLSESPCCDTEISSTDEIGYIYGHGVGLCQRGIEQWGEIYNIDYCQMLKKYYHNVCISNTDCTTNSTLLDCENAIPLECDLVYNGSSSISPSFVSKYGCNDWTESGPERVHSFIAPSSGTISATISNFTGDLDVYILGSCAPQDCLGEVFSSHSIYDAVEAGKTYYIVVDSDDGSGSAYDLIVSCENLAIEQFDLKTSIYPNPAQDILHFQSTKNIVSLKLYNTLGISLGFDFISSTSIDIKHLEKGTYFLILTDEKGRKHSYSFLKK